MRLFRGMDGKGAAEGATETILGFARVQHGVFSRKQLVEAGVSDEELLARTVAGWLTRLHRGVYALAGQALSWRGRWLAAVLACGDGAVLSHQSAAALWRISTPQEGDAHVTLPGTGGRRRRDGIRLHRSVTMTSSDLGERDSIPVTTPARTIVDLARSGLAGRPLERIVQEAEYHRLLDLSAFDAGSHPGLRPPAALRRLLATYEPGSALTRSELEERFLLLCRSDGIPAPLVNAELLGLTVDFLWPRAALVVEVDGREGHATHRAFQADRDRDARLVAAGFRVMRFTWRDVTVSPRVVSHRIRRALAG